MSHLDSHCNFHAFGEDSTDVGNEGRVADVSGYDSQLGTRTISIRDKAVAYDDPHSMRTILLIARNSLHIPGMPTNLLSPFLIREAGNVVNDVPMQHLEHPTSDDHCIIDPRTNIKLRLELDGTFSGLTTRALTDHELQHIEDFDQLWLTPDEDSWDPNVPDFEEREQSLMDVDGNVKELAPQDLRPMGEKECLFAEVSNVIATEEVAIPTGVTEDEYEYLKSMVCNDMLDDDPLWPCADYQNAYATSFPDSSSAQVDWINDTDTTINPFLAISDDAGLNIALQLQRETANVASTLGTIPGLELDDDLFQSIGETIARAESELSSLEAGKASGRASGKDLSNLWQIKIQDAERTVRATTQLHPQNTRTSLTRQLSTNDRMLRYRRLKSVFFTDTLGVHKKYKSTRQYRYVQVFVSDTGFIYIHFMREQKHYDQALKAFSKEVGAPDVLVCDPHPTQTKLEVKEYCNKIGTKLRVLEERTQWADRAELYIGILKDGTRKDMRTSDAPVVLWDYCMERRASIYNMTVRDQPQLGGQSAYMRTFGETPDISNLLWGWYDWCYYRDNKNFPYPREVLGRVLGPAKNQGNEMAQYILQINGEVVVRRTLRRLRPDELAPSNEVESRRRHLFNLSIQQKLGSTYSAKPIIPDNPFQAKFEDVANDEELKVELPYTFDGEGTPDVPIADIVDSAGKPIGNQSFTDTLIGIEVAMSRPEDDAKGLCRVLRAAVDKDGKTTGHYDANPNLNTLIYECQCWDGKVRKYAANIIAENILNQVNADGTVSCSLDRIVDHKREGDAVRKEDLTGADGSKLRFTTKGWKFKCLWKDGSYEWVHLSDLKESNPVDVAEYAQANQLLDEPAFTWWCPYTLRKKTAILNAVNSRVCRSNVKYGIRVPRTLKEARQLDRINGNNCWEAAYEKEMKNVGIAFRILEEGQPPPPGYTKSSGHLVFDVKMDFTRKARWVKDGHKTADPETSSYAGVVSKESIRVLLTHAALHDIPVCAADIRNAYLSAKSSEKHYVVCGLEFGEHNVGKVAVIERALYGGKVAGRDYWHHLRKIMHDKLGFTSSRGDPDVWFREARRTTDGSPYYEYVLIYTDDILVISDNAEAILRNELGSGEDAFELKEESIGKPNQYLGGKLSEVTLNNGNKAWQFSSAQYVKEAVKNVEAYLADTGRKLPRRALTPFSSAYRPEIDVSRELHEVSEADAAYFHSLIGVLRWIVELGRADICLEVSMLSSHLALPREGHLEQAFHIFAYLKEHHNAAMVFDPTEWNIPQGDFVKQDWNYSIYGCDGLEVDLPDDMPKPLGNMMRMHVYVDSDHAGDEITRRSRTGFVVFLNGAPIYWFSKRQTSCETSTFGSEFIAMKTACDYVKGLRYKLRMMGIAVPEPTYIYGDNQSVLANTGNPGSTLKKKSSAIAYHFVREGCVRDEWRTDYINTHFNVADLFTKPLPSGAKRWGHVARLLHYVAPREYYQ